MLSQVVFLISFSGSGYGATYFTPEELDSVPSSTSWEETESDPQSGSWDHREGHDWSFWEIFFCERLFSYLCWNIFLFSLAQIALRFPHRFWDKKIQGADYFGHVPPSPDQRGMFSVFYDMDPQVWVSLVTEDKRVLLLATKKDIKLPSFPRGSRPSSCPSSLVMQFTLSETWRTGRWCASVWRFCGNFSRSR